MLVPKTAQCGQLSGCNVIQILDRLRLFLSNSEEKSEHKSGKLYRPSSKVSEAIIARKQREKEAAEIRAERERQDRPVRSNK